MRKIFLTRTAILVVLSALSLSACFDNDNRQQPPVIVAPPPPPPPPPPPTTESNFGAGFEMAFGQSAFAEPIDPQTGDIIALDKAAEPIDVPDPN